jgi:hypothetical protein
MTCGPTGRGSSPKLTPSPLGGRSGMWLARRIGTVRCRSIGGRIFVPRTPSTLSNATRTAGREMRRKYWRSWRRGDGCARQASPITHTHSSSRTNWARMKRSSMTLPRTTRSTQANPPRCAWPTASPSAADSASLWWRAFAWPTSRRALCTIACTAVPRVTRSGLRRYVSFFSFFPLFFFFLFLSLSATVLPRTATFVSKSHPLNVP